MSSSDGRASRAPPVRDGRDAARRRSLRAVAALLAVPLVASCGFHLRGQAAFNFDSIYVNAGRAAAFQSQLTRAIESSGGTKVLTNAQGAQVILNIPSIVDQKDVLSLSAGGGVLEYLLIMRVSFRLHDTNGLDWLPPGEIVLRRTYTFNESEVLARDLEEQRLLRDMQNDAVAQLVRRLQAARKPA